MSGTRRNTTPRTRRRLLTVAAGLALFGATVGVVNAATNSATTATTATKQSIAQQTAERWAVPKRIVGRPFPGKPTAGKPTPVKPTATTPTPTATTPTPTTPTPTPTPTNGSCQLPAPQPPGTSEAHTISSGGRERAYRLHLPATYQQLRDWPVVLAFHGHGNTAAETEKFSKLSTLPAVVVYPEGVVGTGSGNEQAWQGAPYAAAGVDDVAFTGDLLDRVEATLCVDKQRVYATGKSNGAGFVGTLLACRMADRIAAVAPVAAALYPTGQPCRPSRPMPIIEFHGTGDTTIPYNGDAARGLPAIPVWAAGWAARNGCNTNPGVTVIAPDITTTRWTGCTNGAEVRHVAVTGGGHTWPGADSASGSGYTTQTIEASDVMWQFLQNFRTPPAAKG